VPIRAPVPEPLDGVRVLDLTRLLPGAYATLLLSDLGADVVKIEDPRGGDHARRMPPLVNGVGIYFEALNRNKRSVTLDLRAAGAAGVLDALAATSDVMVDSFRPRTARRLGVDAATVRSRHPRLICASITGFGSSGPYEDRAAHDINYEALAGLLMRRHGAAPTPPGPLIGDIGAAMQAALRILAAIIERGRTGTGSVVDVSIHEAALAWSMFPQTSDFPGGCYGVFETADGRWLALGALEEKFWRTFCERIGRPDLLPGQHVEGDARERVRREVCEQMRTRTRDQWLAHFADVDACLTPILTPDEVLADPHVVARGAVRRQAGITFVAPPGVTVRSAPALGADTEEILAAAGMGDDLRVLLRRQGVI
jgi:alpha-methylacyl-CoA racemase